MNQLHPGARWQFRIRGYFLFLFFGIFFGMWLGAFFASLLNLSGASIGTIISSLLFFILIYFLGAIVLVEIYSRMSYTRWFYEFNDDGLKLERGVIWKKYSNIPYERIQNVDVQRGIIARILGFSTIMIQTAGYSGNGRFPVEGYIPAVEMGEAEKIREFVMKKIKQTSRGKQGL